MKGLLSSTPHSKELDWSFCECYVKTMLSPQEDAYGRHLYEHLRGLRTAEVVEREDGGVADRLTNRRQTTDQLTAHNGGLSAEDRPILLIS